MRAVLLLLLAMLTLSASADEVRRLRFSTMRTADTAQILRRLFPQGNYSFDRAGNCYVAGAPDELEAIQFPTDLAALWEPVGLKTRTLPLVGGCHFAPDEQAIESVPVAKIIGYLQTLFPKVVFVPGPEGRWQVVRDPPSVEAVCLAAEQLPEALPLQSPGSSGELMFTGGDFMLPLYDNAFSQNHAVFQGSASIEGARTFPDNANQNPTCRLLFRY